MNSLTELNAEGLQSKEYVDDRPYSISLQPPVPLPIAVTALAGRDSVVPITVGADVIDMQAQSANFSYTLFTTDPSVSFYWPVMPAGVSLDNPEAGAWRLSNVNTLAKWEAVKYPTVQYENGNAFSYTSSIDDHLGNSRSWTTSVTQSANSAVTQSLVYRLVDDVVTIYNGGTLLPTGSATITLAQISPAPTNPADGGVFTIQTGDETLQGRGSIVKTGTDLNNSRITFALPSGYAGNMMLNYSVTIGAVTQTIPITITRVSATVPVTLPTIFYSDGAALVIPTIPYTLKDFQILDDVNNADGVEYTVSIVQNNPTVGDFVVAEGSEPVKSILFTGTKQSINARLAKCSYSFIVNTVPPNSTFTYNQRVRYPALPVTSANYETVQVLDKVIPISRPIVIGDTLAGGYYACDYDTNENGIGTYTIIVSPRESGERLGDIAWKTAAGIPDGVGFGQTRIGDSKIIGFDNFPTDANELSQRGLALAQWVRNLGIDNYNDWYIPSLYELMAIYQYLKPTIQSNVTDTGTNPYSVPIRYSNYTSRSPAATQAIEFFQQSAAVRSLEGFAGFPNTDPLVAGVQDVYWTSTAVNDPQRYGQINSTKAYAVRFSDGAVLEYDKTTLLSVRAIRRVNK